MSSTNEIGSSLVKSITGGTMDINNMATTLAEASVAGDRSSLQSSKDKFSVEQSALRYLQTNLSAFNSYVSELSKPESFSSFSATSSNESLISVNVSSPDAQGSYFIEPQQLAQGHAIVSKDTFSSRSHLMNTGDLTISVGGKVSTINIGIGENSLENIQRIVNNSDLGVNMSIINNGSGYQVMFSSLTTGRDSEIKVSGIDGLNSSDYLVTSQAQDSVAVFNGFPVTSSTNSFEGLVKGVDIRVNNASIGEKVAIEVGRDTVAVKDSIVNIAELYNQVDGILDELGNYDKSKLSEEELASDEYKYYGDLAGSSTLKMISDQLRRSVTGTISELTGESIKTLSDVGIQFNREGLLEVDEGKLQRTLDSNTESVSRLFSKGGVSSDPMIEVNGGNDRTLDGNYAIEVTKLATQASISGTTMPTINAQRVNGDILLDQAGATQIGNNAFLDINIGSTNHLIDLSSITSKEPSKDALAQKIQSEIDAQLGANVAKFGYNPSTGRFNLDSVSGSLVLNSSEGLLKQGFDSGTTNGEDLVEIITPLSASLSADNSELSQFSIPEGRYLPSEIAGRIQSSLNSSANLSTVGASVSVSVSNGILEMTSNRFGTGSRIELANIAGGGQIGVNAQSNNGENMDGVIKTSDGDLLLLGYVDPKDGRKVTISDYSVTDTGPAPVRGLSFSVLGGDLGARGNISFSQGFASRLESTINSFFEDGGLLVSRLDAITQKEKQFEDKEKQLDTRYERILTRYQLQFSALQSILSSTEQTKSYLSSAFGNNS